MLVLSQPTLESSADIRSIYNYVEFDLVSRAKLPLATFKDFQGNQIPFCYPFRTNCSQGMMKITHGAYFQDIFTFMVDETKTWGEFAQRLVDLVVMAPGTYLQLNYERGGEFSQLATVFAATWVVESRRRFNLTMKTLQASARYYLLWGSNSVKDNIRTAKQNLEWMRMESKTETKKQTLIDDFGGIITPKKEKVTILKPSYDSLDDGYGED